MIYPLAYLALHAASVGFNIAYYYKFLAARHSQEVYLPILCTWNIFGGPIATFIYISYSLSFKAINKLDPDLKLLESEFEQLKLNHNELNYKYNELEDFITELRR
jgi:hypothetical protein